LDKLRDTKQNKFELIEQGTEKEMPIYEYRCEACGKKTSIITLRISDSTSVTCNSCGSERLTKLLHRVAIMKSEEARLESLMDPTHLSGLDENDPVGMAKWMKRMGKEMGDDFDDTEIDQIIEETAHEAEGARDGREAPGTDFEGCGGGEKT